MNRSSDAFNGAQGPDRSDPRRGGGAATAQGRLPDPRAIERCVVVERSVPFTPSPPWWLYLAACALPVGQVGLVVFANAYGAAMAAKSMEWGIVFKTLSENVSWWLFVMPLLIGVDEALAMRRRRRLACESETSSAADDAGFAALAWAGRARAASRARDGGAFDLPDWWAASGGDAPRLVVFDNAWPRAALSAPPGEEIDLGAGRERGPQERRAWRWTLILAGVFGAAAAGASAARGASPLFILGVAGIAAVPFVVFLWQWSERAGVSMLPARRVTAAPGRVETTRYGRTVVFTPAESTLVLERMRPPLLALGEALRNAVDDALSLAPRARARSRGLVAGFVRHGWLTRWRRLERMAGLGKFRRPVRAVIVRPDGARVRLRFLSGREDPGLADLVVRWLS